MKGQAPVANFTANVITGCSPLQVNFTDQSTGSPRSWHWDFGNGQLSIAQNPSMSFNVGTYSVTLVVQNADGINSIKKTDFIVVNPSPTAKFSADKTLSCLPATIQFTDLSVPNAGTINKWEWDFGDNGTAGSSTPSHAYTAAGFYTVYLKVTSTTGCSGSTIAQRYIRMVNGMKADFDFSGPSTCNQPYSLLYRSLTSGPGTLTYLWNLGNGNTSTAANPPATYTTAGTYTIKLTAQSEFGCVDSIQKNIPVKGVTSTFSISPDSACLGSPLSFKSTSNPAPAKVLWDFGDGTSNTQLSPPSKTYVNPGTYPVKLISSFASCTDTLIKNVTVFAKPAVDFTAPKYGTCQPPLTVSFQDLSPDAVTAVWNFGDGSTSTSLTPSHTYKTAGAFTVTLTITDSKGCSNTITKNNFVNIAAPAVSMKVPAGLCTGQNFTPVFTGGSVEGIASYLWDFGDGTTSSSPSPSHNYTSAGIKTVKVSIVTNDGCSASGVSAGIQVGDKPVIDFTANKISPCRSDSVRFTNLSTPPGDKWLWSFGDTSTAISTLQNPVYKYTDTGYFDVKLAVTSNGCTDSLTKFNFVHALPPLANFGYKPDCANQNNVSFIDSSLTSTAYSPIAYLWNFGDPASTTDATTGNTSFTYPGPPSDISYNVKLVVNNGICYDTIIKKIQLVNETAAFKSSIDTVCRNTGVTFTSTNTPSFFTKYEWLIDGASHVTTTNFFGTPFSTPGSHSIQLIITDINNCTSTSAVSYVFVTGPTALFGVANNGGCVNSLVQFMDSSKSATGTVNKWAYNFGDGSPVLFSQNPQHKYADTGVYTVTLTVNDNLGCQDTYQLVTGATITRPVPLFSAAQTVFCPGTPLQFTDSSAGRGLSYTWYFGDGNMGTGKNPLHSYPPSDSIYTVKLVIKDTVGCTDSLTRANYISIRSPKPLFDVKDTTSLCPPLETKFTFKGKDYDYFFWDFGDGSDLSPLASTSHFYNAYGLYKAKLYTVGYGGCVDSAVIPVNVANPYAGTSAVFDPANPSACNQLTVHFSLTVPSSTAFNFYFGDGTFDTSKQLSFDHLYSLPNTYSPYIILTDSTGCQVPTGNFGNVKILGAVPLFGIDKKKFCDSGTVYFSDYSQEAGDPIITKTWDFGDGTPLVVLPQDAMHDYLQPGLYVPVLTATTANCVSTFTDTVRVLATPKPVITSVDAICNNLSVTFAGSLLIPPDTAITWKWGFDGQTSGQQQITVNYKDTGLHHITLEATNSAGCKGDTSKDIIVYPLPAATVTGDTTILSGGNGITVPLTYSSNAVSFNWTPADYLSCTNCPNPFATPKFTTSYKVTVTDANGCISTRDLTLVVVCNNKNFFIPNTFSPNNDGSNDVFYPRGKGINLINALRIFNRWGELVFEKRNFPANDALSGWDGMFKGRKASSDTYIYMIDIICDNATVITYKGNITLIR